jgi:hypothetical protein
MEDLTNILKNEDDELNEEKLKKYLSGDISDEERHEIEKQMADSDFINDAVEGLQNVSDKQNLDEYVNHLNKDLHQYISGKKKIKEKRKIKDISWIIIAVIVILLLCVLAYVVIRMQHQRQLERNSISVQHFLLKNLILQCHG